MRKGRKNGHLASLAWHVDVINCVYSVWAFLTYKAVKDATFLELSTYTDFFRKVFDKMMKNKRFAAMVNYFMSEEKKAKAKLAAELERRKQALFNSFNSNSGNADN